MNISNIETTQILDTTVTVEGIDLYWSSVVRDIAEQADLSVLIPESYKDITVDVSFRETNIITALDELVSSVEDISYRINNDTIIFDTSIAQSVAKIEPQFSDVNELKNVLEEILDDSASVSISDGNIVVGGTENTIKQSQLISELVGNQQPNLWQVQICILSMSHNWQTEFGISGDVGGIIKLETGDENENILNAILNGYWSADMSGGIDDVILRTSLVLLEGKESSIQSTEEIPVPQRTVSPEGTISISGYETVSSGISIKLLATAVPVGIRVLIQPEVADLIRFVDEKPIIARRGISTTVIVEHDSTILLSGLWGNRKYDKYSSPLYLQKGDTATEWLVCARFLKIK